MPRLKKCGHTVYLQFLDNEEIQSHKHTIEDKWDCKFQLFPTNVHSCNAPECGIRKFKAQFPAIISGVDNSFPNLLWDQPLPQTELNLNLLRQSTIYPNFSAW